MKVRTFFENKIPDERLEEFLAIGKEVKIRKGQNYIRAGELPKKFAFVMSGLFRYVYLNEQGKEFTKGIILKDHFISSYSTMISKSPSFFLWKP